MGIICISYLLFTPQKLSRPAQHLWPCLGFQIGVVVFFYTMINVRQEGVRKA